jgi:RsiW-degrading membrane proteinase PrsW (M82 family)
MVRLLALVLIICAIIYGTFWIFNEAYKKVSSKIVIGLVSLGVILGFSVSLVMYYIFIL